MDNENKEIEELETQDTELDVEVESIEETEFDPTESEDFYSNLEAAIGTEEEFDDATLPELSLPEDTFVLGAGEEEPSEDASFDEEIFAGVDAALSEQIAQEFGREPELGSAEEEEQNKLVKGWKAIPTWTKVLVGVILVILLSVGLLFGTAGGKKFLINVAVKIALSGSQVDETPTPSPELTVTISPEPTAEPTPEPTAEPTPEPTKNPAQNPDATPEPTRDPNATPEPTTSPTPTPWPVYEAMDDPDIINILLLGEENIYNARRGRTDAIIVASINLNGGPIKLISFQRDLYVSIAGRTYADKLNAAYGDGNFKCVVETMENNFGIDIDGYAKVDFKGFENLIDSLGGLNISLTPRESEYLNTTKYISKVSERNTVAGYQDMTGAQVLGYCRVRFVPTAQGLEGDRGRNYRHRVVLQALFDKFKDQNITQLIKLKEECLSYVTISANMTDLITEGLFAITENKMYEIETLQFPQSKMFEYRDVTNAKTGELMNVAIYYRGAVENLQEFIYGD